LSLLGKQPRISLQAGSWSFVVVKCIDDRFVADAELTTRFTGDVRSQVTCRLW